MKPGVIHIAAVCLLLAGCGRKSMDDLRERGTMVVAMDLETPGYFMLGGESYGYQYDLLKAYADDLGVALMVDNGRDAARRRRNFKRGEIDMVALPASYVPPMWKQYEIPSFATHYVILARTNRPLIQPSTLIRSLRGSRILISSAFKNSLSCDIMLDSLPGTEVMLSPRNNFDLVGELSGGHCDYLICEQGEAHVACALVGNIRQVYGFEEQIYVSDVVNPRTRGLREDFERWLAEFVQSDEYEALGYLYFEKEMVGQLVSTATQNMVEEGISIYDSLMMALSEPAGYDWRLIAAMAYTESKFNPYIISRRGARGLMQVRPIVARQFHVRESEMMKPDVNISLALRLLERNDETLRIPASTPDNDRMKIVLASYNAGVGHVGDARRLAGKNGEDPNSWDVVANYLELKSVPEYADDDVVYSGRFTGSRETIEYVDRVMGMYASYARRVERVPEQTPMGPQEASAAARTDQGMLQ